MALIKCKYCNHEISDKVKTCIHCGKKQKGFNPLLFLLIIPVVFFLLLITLPKMVHLGDEESLEDFLKGKEFTYTLSGKIYEGKGSFVFNNDNTGNFIYNMDITVLKDVNGRNPFTYSVSGNEITIHYTKGNSDEVYLYDSTDNCMVRDDKRLCLKE